MNVLKNKKTNNVQLYLIAMILVFPWAISLSILLANPNSVAGAILYALSLPIIPIGSYIITDSFYRSNNKTRYYTNDKVRIKIIDKDCKLVQILSLIK